MKIDPRNVRKLILDLVHTSRSSHIASCFSVVDILVALHNDILSDSDSFLLSKGHAAAALYAVLAEQGTISRSELINNYGKDGSVFMTHASHRVRGIDFSSGSLGMLSSVAVGKSIAKKINGCKGRVYVLMSDGELNEGSNWEAFMYAAHRRLDNLTFIIDQNGLQSLTSTTKTLDLGNLGEKFNAFQMQHQQIDGHDLDAINYACSTSATTCKVITARTTKGKGAQYIENQVEWHYRSPDDYEYEIILEQLNAQ